MNAKGFQMYKEQSVNTMTKGEMLLLLYDELLKRLARADIALKDQNYELFEASVRRSKEIVDYLAKTLDFKYPISRQLNQMYDYFKYELIRLEAGRHAEKIPELRGLITELRDAFMQASRETTR